MITVLVTDKTKSLINYLIILNNSNQYNVILNIKLQVQ
jgi:hypothetical protein